MNEVLNAIKNRRMIRVISLLPIGNPAESPQSHRKPLEELIQFK